MSDNYKDPTNQALFVSEIATISLLGRKEDVDKLEELLELASSDDLQRELIMLADIIRSRHNMGLRKDCCNQCPRFDNCELKWLKTERSMRATCCPRCVNFEQCRKEHLQENHVKRRKNDD